MLETSIDGTVHHGNELYRLDSIPFSIDLDVLAERTHVPRSAWSAANDLFAELEPLAVTAQAIAQPKAMYKVAYVDSKDNDSVQINGFVFTSRVLRVNLENIHRTFAYVATCGIELETWAHELDDLLKQFWAEKIEEMALAAAYQALAADIAARYQPGKLARMNPGSLADWPLREQKPLFTLLGDPAAEIGVYLSESFLMTPAKSVSGIQFPTDVTYENCQLCPRPDCPGRRAPYDRDLYHAKYDAA